jgi:hypothetical protein
MTSHHHRSIQTTLVASAVALALGSGGTANAALVYLGPGTGYYYYTDRANFSLLDPVGGAQSGTNDVVMTWDGNAYNSITDYTGLTSVANVTAKSDQTFNAFLWTAHNVQMFVPGSYTFDTASPGGNGESGNLVLNVGASQLGMHMLIDWGGPAATNSCGAANCNIDIAVVFAFDGVSHLFGSGRGTFENPVTCTSSAVNTNCLWNTGAATWFANNSWLNRPAATQLWMLASIDGNGDGIPGIPMAAGGPLGDFNANFNVNWAVIPVPAAVWLFSSGLVGLLGFMRKCKNR